MALAATVPPRVGQPTQLVLHLTEAEGPHGDGRLALVLEAGLLVEGHQELLADEHGPPQARHAAQVLQVAPQQHGAPALLPAVAVDRQHVDVDTRAARDVGGHGLLDQNKTKVGG